MKHLCDGPTAGSAGASGSVGSNNFQQFLTKTDNETKKFLLDYHRRILSTMSSYGDSDQE
jgi:hypothetical protein